MAAAAAAAADQLWAEAALPCRLCLWGFWGQDPQAAADHAADHDADHALTARPTPGRAAVRSPRRACAPELGEGGVWGGGGAGVPQSGASAAPLDTPWPPSLGAAPHSVALVGEGGETGGGGGGAGGDDGGDGPQPARLPPRRRRPGKGTGGGRGGVGAGAYTSLASISL
jgi:hypothetical protein